MALPRSLACPLAGGCTISAGSGAHFGAIAALGGRIHTGLDLRAAIGARVVAPAPGVVTRWMIGPQQGYAMEVQHDGFRTRYMHLSSRLARPGVPVGLGATIARSGASGQVTGAHLHFEVLDSDGNLVDPEPLLFGGQSSANVAPAPWDNIGAYPRDADQSCPAGYRAGTVNVPGVPFTLWFNRPTNPDGTINACIRADLAPGDNVVLAEVQGAAGEAIGGAIGAAIPVLVNGGVVVLVVVLAFAGARQTLGAAAA